jgi:5-methylcytosine-specific restriction endonuclease McrA
MKKRILSEEHKKKISQALKGKPKTEEHKRKSGQGNKGKKRSKEMIERMREVQIGKKHTEETKRKMSKSHKGEKNHLWKGGITPINKKIRNSFEYKLWRQAVFTRDDYTCVWCGSKSGNGKKIVLNADHIKPFCDYPELRLAIDNGRTLCIDCHKKTSSYLNRWNSRKLIDGCKKQ